MGKFITLTKYFVKSIGRETMMIIVMVVFPLILLLAAVYSAPRGYIPLVLDGVSIIPPPEAIDVTVIIYSVTAIAFLASLMSFFISFELQKVMPRLRIMNYAPLDIGIAFISLITMFNFGFTLIITSFTMFWIEPIDLLGYIFSVYLVSIIFSIIGLIFSRMIKTKSLGILLLLTIVTMDTGFLENPVLSRRYNEPFMDFMPSHLGLVSLFRSAFNTGVGWGADIPFAAVYVMVLFFVYILIIMKTKK